jgi:antiviral defense system Shedu protein SduA
LAGKYVPDFLACDTDSLGLRWLLVELETPQSSITLSTKNELDASARRGVTQIKEWREWLQNNIDMARRPVEQDGLGLADIRPRSEGLVLVGRRTVLNDNAGAVRHPYREDDWIRIHTYDWLVESLFGILAFAGPPRASPHVIKPPRD